MTLSSLSLEYQPLSISSHHTWTVIATADLHKLGYTSFLIVLSRVTVTKARVWIGESVYWIFTSCNYK
jgi:hypothetical protein